MPEYVVRAENLPSDPFVRAYLEAAEWADVQTFTDDPEATGDEGREALELSVSPTWTAESIAKATEDCDDFRQAAGSLLDDIDDEQAGHDFWLTRNRHGAGFWGRGLGEIGDRLTDLCRPYGEAYVNFDPESESLELN